MGPANRIGTHQGWEKRDSTGILFVSNDTVFAREFSNFAKLRGINVSCAWSLEGLDFLPLLSVNLAVITSDRWYDHEIFGRPVSQVLQSFPKIIVVLQAQEPIPGGKALQENVQYVHSHEELYNAVSIFEQAAKKDADPRHQ